MSLPRLLSIVLAAIAVATLVSVGAGRMLAPRIATPAPLPPKACPSDAGDPFDELLRCGTKLYSQYNEELIIRHFFRDRRDGVFVDIGAAHYRNNSTTYYLEYHLGWSGVAVDAMDEYRPTTRSTGQRRASTRIW